MPLYAAVLVAGWKGPSAGGLAQLEDIAGPGACDEAIERLTEPSLSGKGSSAMPPGYSGYDARTWAVRLGLEHAAGRRIAAESAAAGDRDG